jgi:hypothetical protein
MRSPAIAFTVLALTPCGFAPAQAGPQLRFSGDDPVVQAQKHKQTPADYMDLFRPDSARSHASQRVAAFKISWNVEIGQLKFSRLSCRQ